MKLSVQYLAGLFDGEGCIHIAKIINKTTGRPSFGVRAIFCMIHRPIIEKIAEQFGMSFCKLRKDKFNAKWRNAYQVQICGRVAREFLISILPYLQVKKEEAELAIKLQDHIDTYRAKFYWMSDEQKKAIDAYRLGIKEQITALKWIVDATDGMVANSVELQCPAREGAEGQYRAKQTVLKTVGRV